MRQESAPQYALGKKPIFLCGKKRVVKTLLPQKLFLFSVVKEKKQAKYYYYRNKEKSGLIRKLNSKKMPTQHCISLRIREDYYWPSSCALS